MGGGEYKGGIQGGGGAYKVEGEYKAVVYTQPCSFNPPLACRGKKESSITWFYKTKGKYISKCTISKFKKCVKFFINIFHYCG